MDNKYKRLLGNSIWNFAGNAGSKVLAFLLLPFYTKWLGTEGYGFSDLITTYSTLLGGVVTLCVSDAILIFVKDKDVDGKRKYFTSAITVTLLLFIIWLLIVVLVKSFDIRGGFIYNNIGFIFGMIVSNFLQTSTQQMALALDKIKIFSISGIVHCFAIFGFSWFMIPLYGVYGYVCAMILSNIVTATYTVTLSSSWRYLSLSCFTKETAKEILRYSVPLIPNAIMWWLVSSLNRPLMEKELGLSAIGLYAVAQKFPGIITLLFSIFSVTWTVSMLEEYSKPNFESFYKNVYRAIFSIVIICTLILMLFSKAIISILTAPDFHEAYKYMIILISGAVFSSMSSFFGTCFGVVKQSKYLLYSSLWGAAAAIILNYLLIPRFAIYGASISVVLSFLITAVFRYIYSRKFVKTDLVPLSIFYSVIMIITVLALLLVRSHILQVSIVAVCCFSVLFLERKNIGVIKNVVLKRFNNEL